MNMKELTSRQAEVMALIRKCGAIRSGLDRAVLEALFKKGLVLQHHNQEPRMYYTWTFSEEGRRLAKQKEKTK